MSYLLWMSHLYSLYSDKVQQHVPAILFTISSSSLAVQYIFVIIFCISSPVLPMFPSPAALRRSSARLQHKELLQGRHQGHERCSSQWSPPYRRRPIYGSLPGSTGCHHAPTGPLLWSHQWYHQSPLFRHQQTCRSITSGPLWRLTIGCNPGNSQSPQPRSH